MPTSVVLAKGGIVGNGGGTIVCVKDEDISGSSRPPHPVTVIDELLIDELYAVWTLGPDNTAYRYAHNVEEFATQFEAMLRQKLPSLAESFSEYARSFLKEGATSIRPWRPTAGPLPALAQIDPAVSRLVPASCREWWVEWVVLRTEENGRITYAYVKKTVDDLARRNPHTTGYLMVHEWLWDFTSDERIVRMANALLQSEYAAKMAPPELEEALKKIGFPL